MKKIVPGGPVRLPDDGASIGLFEGYRPGLRIGSSNAELVTLPDPEALIDVVKGDDMAFDVALGEGLPGAV